MSGPRRELTAAVVVCALGAALALFAAARPWRVVSAKLPSLPVSGTDEVPWLSAVALVALAGAGALLAVRGRARTFLGPVLVLTAVALVGAGGYGLAHADGSRVIYPALVGLGGLAVGYAGVRATVRGHTWPALGARYEPPATAEPVEYVERSGPSRSDVAMWDALDRGEDPTARG